MSNFWEDAGKNIGNAAKGAMGFVGDTADNVGTFFNAPDWGISETLAGGNKTSNTGRAGAVMSLNPVTDYYYKLAHDQLGQIGGGGGTGQGGGGSNGGGDGSGGGGGGSYNSGGGYTGTIASSYNSAAATAARAAAAKAAANEASRGNTQKAIDSLGTELNVGYGNIDNDYDSIKSKYDKELAKTEGEYKDQTVTNTNNLSKNKQNGLLAAAQGRRGLISTLSAMGALGGDGIKLADNAVTNSANADLGEATDTFATNATTLDKALDNFKEEDKDRRAELDTSRTNQRTALEGKVAAKRQSYLQKMADLFGEIGDGGNATNMINQAGNLNGEIAAKTAVASTPFAAKTAAFTPGELADYLSGAGDMTVSAEAGDATGTSVNPTILAGRKKDKNTTSNLVTA